MSPLAAIFTRELTLAWRAGPAAPLGFFLGVTVLVPLAMGPERVLLAQAGAPLIWIAAALAALMTLERLFQADLEDGALDQLFLADASLTAIAAAKGAALWIAVGLPLSLAAAPAVVMLGAEPRVIPGVVAGLMLANAAFIGAGLAAAAVTAGVKRAGVLIALLALPFFAPPVLFGAADAGAFGPAFAMLAACAAAAAALGPLAAAAALRAQVDA